MLKFAGAMLKLAPWVVLSSAWLVLKFAGIMFKLGLENVSFVALYLSQRPGRS